MVKNYYIVDGIVYFSKNDAQTVIAGKWTIPIMFVDLLTQKQKSTLPSQKLAMKKTEGGAHVPRKDEPMHLHKLVLNLYKNWLFISDK